MIYVDLLKQLLIADVMHELQVKFINNFIIILDSYEKGNPLSYKDLKLYIDSYEMDMLTEQKYYELVFDSL